MSKTPNIYTAVYPGVVSEIKTDVNIGHPVIIPAGHTGPITVPHPVFPTKAIWDTGATHSMITNKVAHALGVRPTGKMIGKGVFGEQEMATYYVSIILPNNVIFHMVKVGACEELSDPSDLEPGDVLIGMDIIGHGDFAITNHDGQTCFSFRLPSFERIDFNNYVAPKKQPLIKASWGGNGRGKNNKRR